MRRSLAAYGAPLQGDRALTAHVKGGRLLLDEPTDLPDGAEVELTLVEDEFDPEERARLDAALELSMAQSRAGQFVDGDIVVRSSAPDDEDRLHA